MFSVDESYKIPGFKSVSRPRVSSPQVSVEAGALASQQLVARLPPEVTAHGLGSWPCETGLCDRLHWESGLCEANASTDLFQNSRPADETGMVTAQVHRVGSSHVLAHLYHQLLHDEDTELEHQHFVRRLREHGDRKLIGGVWRC